ncbi:MAG: sugar phosphate isomerase/epimerase [Gammaproteobacteria bacterium]|nr:sugar phosphate isomerase/epimerase [Gammaproteobacteria bacterium]
MQKLEVFQSLWAMERRRPGVPERSMEENFRRAADAGYHGLCVDPAVHEIESCRALKPLYLEYGLKCMVNAFPASLDELKPLLELARDLDACLVNVIGQVMPLTVEEGLTVIRRWMQDAEEVGLPLLFETHRDCTLNDLYYTLQLIEAEPGMRLCADLSHYVIDREMRLPLSAGDRDHVRRILERSDSFQGRVANREQIQVQIDFPQHQDWVAQFRAWWREGIGLWRRRNGPDAMLIFLCELGPPPYAMTDARQEELSDRWAEALTIRGWIEEIWASLEP